MTPAIEFLLRHPDDELEGYVLGALDDDVERAVGRHLRLCRRCARMANELFATAARLAFAAPLHRPPDALKNRVLEAALGKPWDEPPPFMHPEPEPHTEPPTSPWMFAAVPTFLALAWGATWWATNHPHDARSKL